MLNVQQYIFVLLHRSLINFLVVDAFGVSTRRNMKACLLFIFIHSYMVYIIRTYYMYMNLFILNRNVFKLLFSPFSVEKATGKYCRISQRTIEFSVNFSTRRNTNVRFFPGLYNYTFCARVLCNNTRINTKIFMGPFVGETFALSVNILQDV